MSMSSTPLSSTILFKSVRASREESSFRKFRTVSIEISPWKSMYMFSIR
jgi:hypothetical protein